MYEDYEDDVVFAVNKDFIPIWKLEMERMSMAIDQSFVARWSTEYNNRFQSGDTTAWDREQQLRSWLSSQSGPKCFDREHFLLHGEWKLPRQRQNYLRNTDTEIRRATQEAYYELDPVKKLNSLTHLHGVGVTVAASILHFLLPDEFAVFDFHCRAVLFETSYWHRPGSDDSLNSWLEYNGIMVKLARQINVSLRDLDKALWAYHKWR